MVDPEALTPQGESVAKHGTPLLVIISMIRVITASLDIYTPTQLICLRGILV